MFRHALSVVTAAALAITLLAAPPSYADNDSIVTLGVGVGAGYRHAGEPDQPASTKFVNQANVRLKLLWLLGADFSIDLQREEDLIATENDGLRYAAKMRLTALFYPIVTDVVNVYLGTGVGGANKEELFSVTSPGNSYHLGGGVEVNLGAHVTLDASFYMIVPGYQSVKTHVTQLALQIEADTLAEVEAGTREIPTSLDDIDLPDARIGDYITPNNYELMIRVFLFI